jgi:Tfp pilus assembly protein PilF
VMGDLYRERGLLDLAFSEYQVAVKLDAKNAQAYFRMGDIFGKRANVPEQIAHYQKSLKLNPKLVEARYALGVAYFNNNEMEKAISELKRVVRDKPDWAKGHHNLAVLYYKKAFKTRVGRKKFLGLSEKEFLLAIKHDDQDAYSHHGLGKVYQEQGNKDKAKQSYQKALELDPNSKEFKLSLEKLQ